jgi:hypothetical protein
MQFTKLFSCILDSTIWQEPPQTKILWITMLAMSDRNGEVHASVPGLAKRAGITLEECERGIACLMAPDAYSRTKDHDGRRVGTIDGGWALLNHAKYRALLSAEERREYNRQKQAEFRAKHKASANVNDSQSPSAMSAHTESEGEAYKKNTPNPAEASAKGASGELFETAPNPEADFDPVPATKQPKPKPAPKPREQNETLNALATVGGGVAAEVPKTRWSAVQKCLREIREVCPDVTAEEIQSRARNYRRNHPDWTLTPEALTKHWATCGMGQAPAGSPVKAFISPEPANWRGIVDREFPQSTYAGITTPWAKLSVSDRDCITQAIQPYLPTA